jgi:hypothetical protein
MTFTIWSDIPRTIANPLSQTTSEFFLLLWISSIKEDAENEVRVGLLSQSVLMLPDSPW